MHPIKIFYWPKIRHMPNARSASSSGMGQNITPNATSFVAVYSIVAISASGPHAISKASSSSNKSTRSRLEYLERGEG